MTVILNWCAHAKLLFFFWASAHLFSYMHFLPLWELEAFLTIFTNKITACMSFFMFWAPISTLKLLMAALACELKSCMVISNMLVEVLLSCECFMTYYKSKISDSLCNLFTPCWINISFLYLVMGWGWVGFFTLWRGLDIFSACN